jgi:hypothetical protein
MEPPQNYDLSFSIVSNFPVKRKKALRSIYQRERRSFEKC